MSVTCMTCPIELPGLLTLSIACMIYCFHAITFHALVNEIEDRYSIERNLTILLVKLTSKTMCHKLPAAKITK